MSKIHAGKSKFSKFLNGKGFYAVLAVCLIGTGAAAWVAVGQTAGRLTDPSNPDQTPSVQQQVSSEERGVTRLEEAGKPVDGLPTNSSAQASSQSNVSSQSPQSSASSGSSQKQDATSAEQTGLEGSPELQFMLPVTGDVLQTFSEGKLVKSKTLGDWRTHNGVDLIASAGTPIKAVANGTIQKVEQDAMWGTVVEIKHDNDLVSIYKGLSDTVSFEVGENIELGEVIGTVADNFKAELADGAHLHFEMKQSGEYVNPLTAIQNITE